MSYYSCTTGRRARQEEFRTLDIRRYRIQNSLYRFFNLFQRGVKIPSTWRIFRLWRTGTASPYRGWLIETRCITTKERVDSLDRYTARCIYCTYMMKNTYLSIYFNVISAVLWIRVQNIVRIRNSRVWIQIRFKKLNFVFY
jgi:hypothetical protein